MFRMTLIVVLLPVCICPCLAQSRVLDVGDRLQLFVDGSLIDRMNGVSLKMHNPEKREVVFKFDAPWEGGESGYVTVMQAGAGDYRMYYRGGGESTQEVSCVALSKDGINWSRPELGLFEFDGSKKNNIIYRGKGKAYWESHNFTPFLDSNPKTPPEQKFKALGLGRHVRPDGEDVKALIAMISTDGIHWKLLQDKPVITEGSFDSQNVAFWDANRGEYVCYFRAGREGKRSINRTTSKDFVNWAKPEMLEFGDTPLEHFYTNAITPYPREPGLYLGFPMRFVPERKTIGADARKTDGVSDAVFISSRDGLHFDRTFMEAWVRPGLDKGNWGNAHGNNTPAWGMLQTSLEEISVYWCEHYGSVPHIRRGVLRTDGFASVNAPHAGGEFVTEALRFSGRNLLINYSTSAAGYVKLEVQDAEGKPLKGFSLEECKEVYGDEIERIVSWDKGSDLSSLAGKPVRLRFSMKDADLYSLRFR